MQLSENHEARAARLIRIGLLILALAGACLLWGGVILGLAGIAFGGAVLSFLLSPLVRVLENRFSRAMAVFLTLLGVAAAIAALVTLMLPALSRQLSTILDLLPNAAARLQALGAELLRRFRERAPELALPEFNIAGMEGALSGAARGAAGWLGNLTTRLYRFALMAALS